jgi:hypothetical protein
LNGITLVVAKYHDQTYAQVLYRVFDAGTFSRAHDIAGDLSHKQITLALIEYKFRGHPSV